jgi:superoxide reductase
MTKRGQIYLCKICGNLIEVLHEGEGELVCCGEPMILQAEQISDLEFKEKHVPIIEELNDSYIIKIGEELHPMTEEHYIEWIEVQINDKVGKKFLKPGDEPLAQFFLKGKVKVIRAYCNAHGLWAKYL